MSGPPFTSRIKGAALIVPLPFRRKVSAGPPCACSVEFIVAVSRILRATDSTSMWPSAMTNFSMGGSLNGLPDFFWFGSLKSQFARLLASS